MPDPRRRMLSYTVGLDTDGETVHSIRVKWLYEMDNPANPDMPLQQLMNSPLEAMDDLDTGDMTSMLATSRRVLAILDRKMPLVVPQVP